MKQSSIVLEDKAKQSELDIKFSKSEKKREKKKLQRTAKWREQRRGNWTGSQLKTLMAAKPGKGKLSWDNVDRLFSFGVGSLKYIYANAKERQTGKYVDTGDGTYAMRYGTVVEPLIFRATKEKLKDLGVNLDLKEVGYKVFPDMPNAGVSSDAKLVSKKGKTKASVEMKASTNWETHFERTYEATVDSSKDFWQIMGQMIAHNVSKCYYVVAEPPTDIKKYLFHDGDIQELYEDFKKECPISIEIVKASDLHCKALKKRIMIAEDALNEWLSIGGDLRKILEATIKTYENDPNLFNKDYIAPLPFQKKKKVKENKISGKFFKSKK